MQTQWVYAGQFALPVGLNYPAVESAMNMLGVKRKRRPELLTRLQVMEAAALPGYRRRIAEAYRRR